MATKNPTGFRISEEAKQIIKEAKQKLGMKPSAVVEMALRGFKHDHITYRSIFADGMAVGPPECFTRDDKGQPILKTVEGKPKKARKTKR